jgi:hypothetical protein
MKHSYNTTRNIALETFPGVEVVLRRMTEGRRLELRNAIGEPNRRIRDILREQAVIEQQPEEIRDVAAWLALQDEFDGIMIEKVNVAWVKWGVKSLQGLEVDGRILGLEDWADWPSSLFDEVLNLVKQEAELNGNERKNSESATISGAPADLKANPSTAPNAKSADGGGIETVVSISQAG